MLLCSCATQEPVDTTTTTTTTIQRQATEPRPEAIRPGVMGGR
jgi:hypothetical protein